MNVLKKRPLALILCIMLGGFSFFIDLDIVTKLVLAIVPIITLAIINIFDTLKCGRKLIVTLSLIALSLSIALSALWSFTYYPSEFYDSSVEIKAQVYDIDNSSSRTSVIVCKTEEINHKRDSHTILIYLDKSIATAIRKYDIVQFRADMSGFAEYDDGFDGRSYYVSLGLSAVGNNVSDLAVIDHSTDRLDEFLSDMRLSISNTLKMRTDFDTGAFLSALIVGDRSDLSGNTKLNFSRLGISHILALSGMHLAILSIALNALLSSIGLNKKIRVSILFILIIFYMSLTGFSSSVLRSGIMLLISGALFLLTKKADGITSLCIAVFLIVLFDPCSVYDTSLWLSAFATLGVIAFAAIADKTDKNDSKWRKLLTSLKNGCLVSVFAFSATFMFTALRFDGFSVISVFTTLIFSFVIQIFIYSGLILLILGGILPLGKIVVFLSDCILQIADAISSVKFVYVSMNSVIVKILIIILTTFFFAFLVLEIKNKKLGICIIIALLTSVFLTAEIDTLSYRYKDDAVYAPSPSGDIMILKTDGDITVIYSGKAFENNASNILDILLDEGVTYIDNLVMSSYSYSTIGFTNRIIDGIKVDKLLIPKPTTSDEIDQAEGMSYLLSGYGTGLTFYDKMESITFGDYQYRLWDKVDYTYGKYPSNVYEVACADKKIVYLSVCDYEEIVASAKHLIYNSNKLVIGSIGNTNYYLFDMRLPELDMLYYFDEGRLTEDAALYYKDKGAFTHCVKTPVSIFN